MPARVLVIGLDAAERDLLVRWADEGQLPVLQRIREGGSEYELENCSFTLPSGIWPEIWSGRSAGKSGFYLPIRQLHTGETSPRPVEPDEVDRTAFWTIASDAGRRVAVVDLPFALPSPGLNGLHLDAWGAHDRPFGVASEPPGLLADVRARFGEYPLWSDAYVHSHTNSPCYGLDGTDADYRRMLDDLLRGLETKVELFLDLLAREDWDLFTCAFGEPQCVGHQFWRFLNAPAAPASFRNAIRDVYRAIDAGIGQLVDAAGHDTTVLVVASHGMGAIAGGPQLIPEVVVRLGLGSGAGTAARVRSRLPLGVRAIVRRLLPSSLRVPLQARAGSLSSPLDTRTTRADALNGDSCSFIRLNMIGREPHGSVTPGVEAEALLEEIRREILALEDPRSGEKIVLQAVTAAEAFGADHHPDVPDLMIAFRHDLGPIDACRSPRVGLVRQPYTPPGRRSGEHPPGSTWLWAAGIPFAAGARHEGNALDVAPTILSLLEVPAPRTMDGQPLPPVASGALVTSG